MSDLPEMHDPAADTRDIFSISRLNREVRKLLENGFPLVWVEGEISNLACPASGHIYFTLKDPAAQVRVAMFRMNNRRLKFKPEDGLQVLVRARISLYESRGDYQLIVEHMEEAGDGALRRAFEILKQRLDIEGLFDERHKKPIPTLPRQIGIITSSTGAAVHDILSVLKRRFPSIPVVIYPVAVQGDAAANQIATTIRLADERGECDVFIIGRGGGSMEDLQAFNDESVARAIFTCGTPVVSAVGHETDFTIADFVADHRAPTPSAAAELLSPDWKEIYQTLSNRERRLSMLMQGQLSHWNQMLTWLRKRVQHPGLRLRMIAQRLDDAEQRLANAQFSAIRQARARLAELHANLMTQAPQYRIEHLAMENTNLSRRLLGAIHQMLENRRVRTVGLARALDTVSPLATLERGYAIVTDIPGGNIIRSARDVTAGQSVEARLSEGSILCRVEETREGD